VIGLPSWKSEWRAKRPPRMRRCKAESPHAGGVVYPSLVGDSGANHAFAFGPRMYVANSNRSRCTGAI
jgi:hypothetical protein